MIAKFEDGFVGHESKKYFKKVVYTVFPEFVIILFPAQTPLSPVGNIVSLIDVVLDLMREGISCELYHSGIPNGKICLTGEIKTPMVLNCKFKCLSRAKLGRAVPENLHTVSVPLAASRRQEQYLDYVKLFKEENLQNEDYR